MLRHLHIQNYALIKHLDIDFESGFSVLTGETGAGKSIILGALNLVMGARADLKAISEGEKLCVIEATFTPTPLPYEDKELIIRRELSASGRSRSFVNDEVVTQTELKELAARLIDIHSQHANLLLGDDNFQLSVVDAIAGNNTDRETYTTLYNAYTETAEQLEQLRQQASRSQKDADYIAFQFQQLKEAALVAGEWEELEQQQHLLSHAEEIKGQLSLADETISNDSNGVIRLLRQIQLSHADATLQERIHSVIIELKDIAEEVAHLQDRVEINPTLLQTTEERLDLLHTLCHKHGVQTVEELIAIRDELEKRLTVIDHYDEEISTLEKRLQAEQKQMEAAARKLTETRKSVRHSISERVEKMCKQLGIQHAKIDIEITPLATYTSSGHDDVQILFAANLGQSLRRVSEVASGGEISRVMLSIKALIASTNGLPTIIFDEIDTGVSGEVASQMGNILREMACSRQVLVITHLPQIAGAGQAQYRVYKQDEKDHTETHIRQLNNEERIHDIAIMLSGKTPTAEAIITAQQLLCNH